MIHHKPDAPYSLRQAILLTLLLALAALICNQFRIIESMRTFFTGGTAP